MKKLLSITLAVFLAGGFLLTEEKKAEAMNNESAALLTAGLVLFGAPIINAIVHDDHRPEPVYYASHDHYPVSTTVVYETHYNDRHYGKKHGRYKSKFSRDRYERDCEKRRYSRRHDHYYR